MAIIPADNDYIKPWVELSLLLFPDDTYEEVYNLYNEYLNNKNVKQKESGYLYLVKEEPVAFINVSLRNDYVNGTSTSPVLYIEALYVKEKYRRQGIAGKLICYIEKLAEKIGINEIASDCLLDNTQSEMFHKKYGFIETERVICFVKEVNNNETD